ncbi:hypothetical protein MKW94_002408 [Papaver nudicaule]|uniref:YkgJ family cysteine cluster protein n=1 Tax=Papaver nudicaule TaxID=74823 RepID=A0AA41SLV3_PAPNU|nr:hypothetical protein [Papaver nudicaule]
MASQITTSTGIITYFFFGRSILLFSLFVLRLSKIGPDGWCMHYEQTTRTCSIYSDRPYFCRVEPGVFDDLYGIDGKIFNKEAYTIKAIYGASSQELENFNRSVRN